MYNVTHKCTFQVLWPSMNDKPVNEQRVARLEKKMISTLDLIENIWLKDKQFLCGDEISVSDIIAICEIDQTSEYIFKKFSSKKNHCTIFHIAFRNGWV